MKHKKVYKKPGMNKHMSKRSKHAKQYKGKFQMKSHTKTHIQSSSSVNKNSLCAPFVDTNSLSSNKKLTKKNQNIINSAHDESCFSIEALRKIASKWNETNSSNQSMQTMQSMHIKFDDNTSGKQLWSLINNVMSGKCKNEICWMKQSFIKDSPLARELLKNFKPMMPKKWVSNPIEWLNTIDIRDVMNQYEIKYPEFEFIGPVPMDFDTKVGFGQCVVDELCNVKIDKLFKKGDTKLGVIFNLDKHTQSGSHWVAMYANLGGGGNGDKHGDKHGEICYWDSYGMKPNNEVVVLMERLKKQGAEMGKTLDIKINKIRHQYKNSECGVYCIYFITSLLDGHSFESVVQNIIADDDMNAKRPDYFNKNMDD
jgi:hypothetical protein